MVSNKGFFKKFCKRFHKFWKRWIFWQSKFSPNYFGINENL